MNTLTMENDTTTSTHNSNTLPIAIFDEVQYFEQMRQRYHSIQTEIDNLSNSLSEKHNEMDKNPKLSIAIYKEMKMIKNEIATLKTEQLLLNTELNITEDNVENVNAAEQVDVEQVDE